MEAPFSLSVESSISEADQAVVEQGLMEHARALGIEAADQERIGVFLRDAGGALVGGLIGGAMWGWLNIRLLWVAEPLRGQGHGARLLDAGEAEGARRGCHHARLETFTMDALRFYERLGYATYGTLPDYPKGFTRYFLAKPIAAS